MRHVVVFWMRPNTSGYTWTQSTLLIKMSRATLKAQIDHRGGDPHITWDPCINSQLQIHLFRTFFSLVYTEYKTKSDPFFFPGKHGSKQTTKQLCIEIKEIKQCKISKNVTRVMPCPKLYLLHMHIVIPNQRISFWFFLNVWLILKPKFLISRPKLIAQENYSLNITIKDFNLNHWHLL